MAANGREIMQRYEKLDGEASTHKDQWDRMAPYLAPSRAGIVTPIADGDRVSRNVYDSTTLMSAELLSMFIAGHVISPSQQWHSFEMEEPEANNDDQTREWLDECRDRSLRNTSNSMFYAEGPEAILDTVAFGTGFMVTEEAPQPPNYTIRGFRGFQFTTEKTGRFLIQEGGNNLVDTAFRKFSLTARVIRDRWGADALPENIKKALAENQLDKKFDIVHAIYPRDRGEYGAGAKGMPWASCWVEASSKELVFESGYRYFPVAVPRYTKTPGEVFGRGRGHIAFGDTWTLNSAKRMALEDWALKIRPPILHGSNSVLGVLRLVPAGAIAVQLNGRPLAEQIAPFQTGSHPEVSQINEENLRKSIRDVFYVEQVLQLLEVHKSEMTLFEYARKLELLFRLIGPVYGRLEFEWLYQQVSIMFQLQQMSGVFSPPPPNVARTNGMIQVRFNNPIAKAQRSGDAEALAMWINDIAPLAQLKPQVLDLLDYDKAADGLAKIRGVPAIWLRSPREVQALRDAMDKQNQQDLQLSRASQVAEAAGKVAPALQVLQGGKGAPAE